MDFAVFKLYYIFLHLYFGVFNTRAGDRGGPIKEELLIKTWSSVKGGGAGVGGAYIVKEWLVEFMVVYSKISKIKIIFYHPMFK